MSIFRNPRETQERRPAERIQMSPNLEVVLWSAPRLDGTRRVHWAFSRVNPIDPTKPFKTLRPEDVLEVPMVLVSLASGFAELQDLDPAIRKQLREVVKLNEPANLPTANGKDEVQKGILTNRAFGH